MDKIKYTVPGAKAITYKCNVTFDSGAPSGRHPGVFVGQHFLDTSHHLYRGVSAYKLKRALIAQRAKVSGAGASRLDRLIRLADRQIANQKISRKVMNHLGSAIRRFGV